MLLSTREADFSPLLCVSAKLSSRALARLGIKEETRQAAGSKDTSQGSDKIKSKS